MTSSGKPTEEDLVKELGVFLRRGVKGHEHDIAELLQLSHVKEKAAEEFPSQRLTAVKAELKIVVDGFDGDLPLALTKLFALDRNQPMTDLDGRRVRASEILKLGSKRSGVSEKTFRTNYEPDYLFAIARRLLQREEEASRRADSAIAKPALAPAPRQEASPSSFGSDQPATGGTQDATEDAQATATTPPRPWLRACASLAGLWRRTRWRGAKGIGLAALAASLGVVAVLVLRGCAGEGASARVLVLLDVSRSMRDYVEGPNPDKVRRIGVARDFATAGIIGLEKRDYVGVWLVTNSPKRLPGTKLRGKKLPGKCEWVPNTHCVLQDFIPARDAREDVPGRIAAVDRNDGGTPLYQAIERGVLTLHGSRDRDPANAVRSLVVVTDGIGKTRRTSGNTVTALAAAASVASNSVQVLITAAGDDSCGGRLMQEVRARFGGICCDARTLMEIDAASRVILRSLHTRLRPPGSRPRECQERTPRGG